MPDPDDDFDAAWAQIVDGLTATDGDAPQEPGPDENDEQPPVTDDVDAAAETGGSAVEDQESPAAPAAPDSPAARPGGLDALFAPLRREEPSADNTDTWEDEGHFVPPPPPEIPAGTPVSRLAWAGAIGGPLVLILIAMTGWDPPSIVAYTAGVGCLAGFATLVWQLPESREDGWDDGTRL